MKNIYDIASNIDNIVNSKFYNIDDKETVKQSINILLVEYYSKHFGKIYFDIIELLNSKFFYGEILRYTLSNIDLFNYEDRVRLSKKAWVYFFLKNLSSPRYEDLIKCYGISERIAIDIINYADSEYTKDIYKSKKERIYDTFEDDVIDNLEKKKLSKSISKNTLQKDFM